MEILLTTNNQGKVTRFRHLFSVVDPTVTVRTLQELGISTVDVKEDAETLAENAEIKARAYAGKAAMPILANDTGFYVEGEGHVTAPKRRALEGVDEEDLTEGEIAERLVNFWKGIARKHGGEVAAAWVEAFALLYPDDHVSKVESRREVVLTDREFGEAHPHLPVRALYYSKVTGKPAVTHTEEEEMREMQPVIDALAYIIEKQKYE